MNKIMVNGRLTKDVEIGETKNGVRRALFTIASKTKIKDQDGNTKTDFFKCIAWRTTADIIAKYLKKGDNIVCYGFVTQKTITKEDGSSQFYMEINVDDFEFNGTTNNGDKVGNEDWTETDTTEDEDIFF